MVIPWFIRKYLKYKNTRIAALPFVTFGSEKQRLRIPIEFLKVLAVLYFYWCTVHRCFTQTRFLQTQNTSVILQLYEWFYRNLPMF